MHSLVVRTDETVREDEENIVYTNEEIKEELMSEGYLSEDLEKFSPWYDEEEWYFGRYPFRILSTFLDKFKYACASWAYDTNRLEELKEVLKEIIPELRVIVFPATMGTDDCDLVSWLSNKGITLKTFLFNKKYIVIVDGDEYCIWNNLECSGIINLDALERLEQAKEGNFDE